MFSCCLLISWSMCLSWNCRPDLLFKTVYSAVSMASFLLHAVVVLECCPDVGLVLPSDPIITAVVIYADIDPVVLSVPPSDSPLCMSANRVDQNHSGDVLCQLPVQQVLFGFLCHSCVSMILAESWNRVTPCPLAELPAVVF
ncbi:hypothetical protein GOODEAATRI_007089 [Goodea atripinnis]|uniref:Secreted protein n=1 Tax=Goodea atripinnis TaxID=208336 RepID=A0ABV0PLJ0_9TELE